MELDFSNDIVEKLLLKKALSDKSWLNILTNVYDKRWFKVPNLGTVLKLVVNFYNKYNSIPSIPTIEALLKKFIEKNPAPDFDIADVQVLLTEVQNLDLNISDDVLSSNLKEFIRRNAFYMALFDNSQLLEDNQDNYQKVVDKCLENFDKVQRITFNDTDLGLDYFDEKAFEAHWDYIKNPEAKVSTGWYSLDQYTNGGFLKGGKMLGLFMAQAGLGKSVFLSNLAVNLLRQNLSVVVISLEMSQDVYAQRFDAHISEKNINRLKENETEAVSKIKQFYQDYPGANLIIKEYPPRSIKSHDIDAYLERLKNNGKKFDVVIVDYLNLVLANHRSESMYKDGLSVSEELRALSYKYKVPVISAVQSNSEGMANESIDMQHVSESRGIVHTADFLSAIYQKEEDRENGILCMRILKNRLGGRVGKISNFKMNPDTLVVSDITFDSNFAPSADEESDLGKMLQSLPDISTDLSNLQ